MTARRQAPRVGPTFRKEAPTNNHDFFEDFPIAELTEEEKAIVRERSKPETAARIIEERLSEDLARRFKRSLRERQR